MLSTIIQLIRQTSTSLPADVERFLKKAFEKEKEAGARYALEMMLQNLNLAREKKQPLCQDTGQILLYVKKPPLVREALVQDLFAKAVKTCTQEGTLRQNSVNPLTDKNDSWNLGPGSPQIAFSEWEEELLDVRLILKGGGCENVSAQFSLPYPPLEAKRNFDGVKKMVLKAVLDAQGKGCGPGILSVIVGGDRGSAYSAAKKQFLRKLGERHEHTFLAEFEEDLKKSANELGIGAMGFGGSETVLDVFCDVLNRVPASYFVTIFYMCWSYRRQGYLMDLEGKVLEDFYGA